MRIIAGKHKGLRFSPPKGFSDRPTTDFAKEALFNILENQIDIEGKHILDLFSGSGSITYEFYSRNAALITSVDSNFFNIKFIRKTTEKLGSTNIEIISSEAIKYIQKCKRKFDLVFCDPPFSYAKYEDLYQAIIQHNLVKPEGCVIIEHDTKHDFSKYKYFSELRKYGHVCFSFFKNFEE
jgi:16S rRNA (guanine(966)-N(2))-methyltransferase RsmD